MQRAIFEVYAKVVDANGTYNTLSGYPKVFDSKLYDDNRDKARQRAYGEYYDCLGAMCKRDDRQLQLAMIIEVATGEQIEMTRLGGFPIEPNPENE